MNPRVPFIWKRPHHLYHGLAIAGYSVFMWWLSTDNWMDCSIGVWQIFIGIGIFIAVDDIIEHSITGSTPLRLLFDRIIYPFLLRFHHD